MSSQAIGILLLEIIMAICVIKMILNEDKLIELENKIFDVVASVVRRKKYERS